MLGRIGHHLRLERRRIAVVTALAFAAGALLYTNIPAYSADIPLPLITGALYAGIVGPVAFLTCIFLPAFRFMLESIALSRLIVAIAAAQFPELAVALISNPLLMALLVVSGGAILSRALHGQFARAKAARKLAGLLPETLFQRQQPVLVAPKPWQMQFVGWIDVNRPLQHGSAAQA